MKSLAKHVVRIRRVVQTLFLGLFFALFYYAAFIKGESASPWLKGFFDFDPLILIGTGLASHALPKILFLSLITIAISLLLGRVFCGWICPLGTVHAFSGWVSEKLKRGRAARDQWSGWQRSKYYVLAALLVMALFGAHWLGVFDPLSLLYRSLATAVYPSTQILITDGANAIYQADPHAGPVHLKSITEPIYNFLRTKFFVRKPEGFIGGSVIFAFFVVIVVLNAWKRRFWCRYICPLGGLLGTCAQRPVMRLSATDKSCTNCGLCAMRCPAGADPDKPNGWRSTECFGCWNCVAACNREAIAFKLKSPLPKPSETELDLARRALITAGVAGVGGLVLFRLSPQAQGKRFNPALIRPPGARAERDFLARCLKCGACMQTCPTNALQPAGLEAGLEGIWTPVLVPRTGYCDYSCNACGQVCPTEAIQPLPLAEKQKVRMGLATFDTTRCLPYAYNRQCMVCEEHCPIPTKAIYFFPQEVKVRGGGTAVVLQPRVDADLCIGCGICENVCVFKDMPAVRVTSANETRHSLNQAVMQGTAVTAEDHNPGEETQPASKSSSTATDEDGNTDPYAGANPYK